MTAVLQRATLSVALPTLALVAIAPAVSGGSRAFAQPGPPTLATREAAVLSFINISSNPVDEWIGTGIAESLASDLNRAGIVAARADTTSVPRATEVGLGSPEAILETGRALGATWLITGAYQRIGDRLRITARVFNAGTAAVIDAVTIDGAFSELFDIQDRVAAQVRESLAAGAGRAAVQPAPVPPARPSGPDTLEPPARAGPMTGIPRPGPGPMAGRPGRGAGGPMAGRPGRGPMAGRPGAGPGGPMAGRPGPAGRAPGPAARPAPQHRRSRPASAP